MLVREVIEFFREEPAESDRQAILRIARFLGINPDTPYGWGEYVPRRWCYELYVRMRGAVRLRFPREADFPTHHIPRAQGRRR